MSARGRSPLMEKLLALGEPEIKQNWLDCAELEIGPEHVEELIGLALDEELNSSPSNSREVWVPVHAWRALGQLRAAAAAEPLTRLLERIYEDDDDWVGEELPRVFGMIGPPAISPLSEYLRANDHSAYAQVAAVEGLQCVGADHPEVRDEVVAVLSGQLAAFKANDPSLNGFLISHLIDLHAVEAAPLMKQAFDADSVELFIMGDWEDAQVELGLKPAREKPRRPTVLNQLFHQQAVLPEPVPEAGPLTRQARRKAERDAAKERKRRRQ